MTDIIDSGSDDDAIGGESVAYVPCFDAAAAVDAADDSEAIDGTDAGFVPTGTEAGDFADSDDSVAVAGSSVGFVAKPCCVDGVVGTIPAIPAGWRMIDDFERSVTDTAFGDLLGVPHFYWGSRTGVDPSGNTTADGIQWRASTPTYLSSEQSHAGVDGAAGYMTLPAGSDLAPLFSDIVQTILPMPSAGTPWYDLTDVRMEFQATIADTLVGPTDSYDWAFNIGPLAVENVYNANVGTIVPGLYISYFVSGDPDWTMTRVDAALPSGTYVFRAEWDQVLDEVRFYIDNVLVQTVATVSSPQRFGNAILTMFSHQSTSGTFDVRLGYVKVWGAGTAATGDPSIVLDGAYTLPIAVTLDGVALGGSDYDPTDPGGGLIDILVPVTIGQTVEVCPA